jgi:hypothetical protein
MTAGRKPPARHSISGDSAGVEARHAAGGEFHDAVGAPLRRELRLELRGIEAEKGEAASDQHQDRPIPRRLRELLDEDVQAGWADEIEDDDPDVDHGQAGRDPRREPRDHTDPL